MTKKTYTLQYLKIYATQSLSIILGIISLFIVVPFLTENKDIYGVYALCISTMVFLSYADLGFLGAGAKYAAEFFYRDEKRKEMEVLGFSGFILFILASLIGVFYLVLSYNPAILISNIDDSENLLVAKKLFLCMAFFSPFVVIQRVTQIIYNVRIEDYIFQGINIVGNILKIVSVFYFFGRNHYDIVSYFLFIQIVPVFCSIIAIGIAKRRFGILLKALLANFRWSDNYFRLTKDLALSSFALTISWVLYYELDQIVIAKMYGTDAVAIYAIAFSLLGFIRMFLGAYFTPFQARFAHFYSVCDLNGLKSFFLHVTKLSFPIVVLPLISLCILSRNFIYSWAGSTFEQSVPIAILFILCNVFAFISYPSGALVVVLEKTTTIKYISFISPLLYWCGILVLSPFFEITAFAIMKFVIFFMQFLIYIVIIRRILNLCLTKWMYSYVTSFFVPVVMVVILSFVANHFLSVSDKGIFPLIINCILLLGIMLIGFSVVYFTNRGIREYAKHLIRKLI